ncbi:MAG: hypothetical protein R8G33_07180 [Gammaproteobacteria bacterium]|nr:hypothetical protein [Gammaproteobacteria bacterium]
MIVTNTDFMRMDTGMRLMDNDPISDTQRDSRLSEEGINQMNNPYIGKERRLAERRIEASERRELVRFEINKAPRRSGKDRRKVNGWAEYNEYKLM